MHFSSLLWFAGLEVMWLAQTYTDSTKPNHLTSDKVQEKEIVVWELWLYYIVMKGKHDKKEGFINDYMGFLNSSWNMGLFHVS